MFNSSTNGSSKIFNMERVIKELKNKESSIIEVIDYNEELQELTIEFIKTKSTYKYYDVTKQEILEMARVSSIGSYFLTKIRNNKRNVQI
jgi:hypothetical protein